MKRPVIFFLFVVCSAFSFLSFSAAAEEAEDDIFSLDELVVTATRREEKVKNLPGSVAVVGAKTIESSNVKEIPELLESIPGVTFRDSYGNGTQFSFGLRGVNPGRCNKVLVMVNGVPMNSGHTGTVFWRDLPSPEQIEKVEVVKGPVSALYGGYGIGGAVNIITKRGAKAPETSAKIEFGSNSEMRISAETGGNVNEKFNYQLGVTHQEGDGFRDRSAFDTDKVSAKFGYLMTDRSEVELDAGYVDNFHEVPGNITLEQFEEDPQQAESQIGRNDLQRVFVNLVYRQDLRTDDNIRVSLYHHTYEMDYMFNSYRTGDYIYDVDTTGGEVQYTLNHTLFGHKSTLIFGPSLRVDSADVQAYAATADGERTDTLKSDGLAEPMFWAVYVQDELALSDALKLTLGLRYDEAQFDNENRLDTEASDQVTMDAISPKLGLSYRLLEHTTLFANVGKGFAPPSTSKLYGSSGNPDLDPETAVNYELSIRSEPAAWVDLTATVYQMDVTDEIISVEMDGEAKNVNAGETRHKGIEAELNFHLPGGFSPFVNATLQEVKFEKYTVYSSRSGATSVYDGNKLPHVPDFHMTAGFQYRHTAGFTYKLTATYEGEKYSDEANEFRVPSYTIWDTRLEFKKTYQAIEYSVFASIRNLFDKTYYAGASGDEVYPSSPRTWLFGVTLSF